PFAGSEIQGVPGLGSGQGDACRRSLQFGFRIADAGPLPVRLADRGDGTDPGAAPPLRNRHSAAGHSLGRHAGQPGDGTDADSGGGGVPGGERRRLIAQRMLPTKKKRKETSMKPLITRLLAAAALTVAAPAAHAAPPFVIGFDIELTGGLAPNGKAALLAMQIWAEEINAKGGLLGRPVKLLYYDDQSNPATVPGIITKLLDVDHVDLLIGGNGTNMLAPALPAAMQRNLTL